MLADAVGDAGKLSFRALAIDDNVTELVGQRDEIAFGIDDDLLHPLRRLLQQPPQEMRFSGAGIALHQETRRQQLLDIELGAGPAGRRSHVDADLQCTSPMSKNQMWMRPIFLKGHAFV